MDGENQPATGKAGGDGGVFLNKVKDPFESKNQPYDWAGLLTDKLLSRSFLILS